MTESADTTAGASLAIYIAPSETLDSYPDLRTSLSSQQFESPSSNQSHVEHESVQETKYRALSIGDTNTIALKDRNLGELSLIVLGGFLLSINGGFINGVTYSSVQALPVSHLSGTSTKAGAYPAQKNN
jgi:hypothetical protein